ncbi:hypothetical protein Dimus_025884 [Dionaea muscipula]
MVKKIGIIGAGVSGLLACKYTLSKGLEPVVLEAESQIGGVWTKTIATTKLQTPKPMYQFTDFPWPPSVEGDSPTSKQVFDYIQSYADHFGLIKHIRFNARVISIDYEGQLDEGLQQPSTLWEWDSDRKWNILVEDTTTHSTETYLVDFVMLCIGRFSGVPNIPEFPPNHGPEAFDGEVMHSMDYSAMDNAKAAKHIKGRKVTVVGFQKSALDIAMESATANGIEMK